MRLSSTSHSPSLLPSPPSASSCGCCCCSTSCEDSMHSAKVAAASPSARQGLVFRGQTAKFSDGYIVQLDSLLLRTSPTVRRPPAQHGLRPLHTHALPYFQRMRGSPRVCVVRKRVRVGCNPGDSCDAHARKILSLRKMGYTPCGHY